MKADALAAALGLGDRARPLLDALAALYGELDVELAARSELHGMPCKAGCDACCHEAVFVSAPEMLAVFAYLLDTRDAAELTALVEEMRGIASRFEDELELLESMPAGEERDEVAARVKFRCPLLGAGGSCSIYPVRELNGRTFGQSWDGRSGSAYGCTLTHARLRVLAPSVGPSLLDARQARARLAARLPATAFVHVYPWWFARYGEALLSAARSD